MNNTSKTPMFFLVSGLLLAIIVIAGVGYAMIRQRTPASQPAVTASGCAAQPLAVGSSGNCVSDLQTMVNYMETSGLTQCPFSNGKTIAVNGEYDAATQTQVQAVQAWANCYNKEEGDPAVLSVNGLADVATWKQVCSYGYRLPKQAGHNQSSYYDATIAAGKDAGC